MEKTDVDKLRSQLLSGLILGFLAFMATAIILSQINATEISNVKIKNIEQDTKIGKQDDKIEKLSGSYLTKDEFVRMFNLLRGDIHEIKQDLKNQ
ncbi:MAG: hypothetical protein K9H62_12430 [Bacteroidales bacterium]|nr:hypothetical protein [Bacteroidales bacterium]